MAAMASPDTEKGLGAAAKAEELPAYATHPMYGTSWLASASHVTLEEEEASKLCCGRPRRKLTKFLDHPIVSGILITLIIFDVALVITEVSIDSSKICKAPEHAEGPPGEHLAPEPLVEAPASPPTTISAPAEPPNGAPAANASVAVPEALLAPEVCMMPCNTTYKLEFPTLETEHASHALHYISVGVLCFFGLETLLLIFALGTQVFKRWLVLLDFAVIAASLVLDVVLNDTAASLIVIIRLWRIVRIMHGIFETVYEKMNRKIEGLEESLEEKEKKIHELEEELRTLKHLTSTEGITGAVVHSPPHSPAERTKKEKKKDRSKKKD